MELANDLIELNHKLEAAAYYEQAIETVTESTMKVMCLRKLLNLRIDCGWYNYMFYSRPLHKISVKNSIN